MQQALSIHRHRISTSIALLLVAALAMIGGTPTAARQEEPIRGINVLFSGADADDPKQIATLLDRLADMHVNTILLTVPIYIDSLTGSQIEAVPESTSRYPNADTPTSKELQAFIKPALAKGFAVWLRPLLDERSLIAENPNAWRGQVQPADSEQFFAAYTATLKTLLTGSAGVSWLVIGTELNTLQESRYDAGWSNMIANLRALPAARGMKLMYAENWDTRGYPQFPAWMDTLDGIAIDAYYPLSGLSNDASGEDVTNAWVPWTESLQAYRDRFPGKPIIFGEAGISSQRLDRSLYQTPWQWPVEGAQADHALQSTYIEGTCRYLRETVANDGSPMIDGVAWWMASVIPVENPATDTTFAIIEKPAEHAITECFASWFD